MRETKERKMIEESDRDLEVRSITSNPDEDSHATISFTPSIACRREGTND